MSKISIIIPVFKTEKYLEKCIRSVMNQTLTDIEILCVDDCSPDGSSQIIRKLAAEDDRIKLLTHTRNLGLGGARNTAIRAASSPYIAGVDSDDYISPEMLERLWNETENQTIDVISFGFEQVDENGMRLSVSSPRSRTELNENHSLNIFKLTNPAFWNKLWRTDLYIANQIYFPNDVFYQDLATTPRIYAMAKTIKLLDFAPYHYLVRSDSVTYTSSPKHLMDFVKVFEILEGFLRRHGLWERYHVEYTETVDWAIKYHAGNVMESALSQDEKAEYLRRLLMIRLGIIEHSPHLLSLDFEEVQARLLKTQSRSPLADKNIKIKSTLRYKLYSAGIAPFLDGKALSKLQQQPARFFLEAQHPAVKFGKWLHEGLIE
ncbi:glycosyltransferase family 2 protein [Rhizobium binxianense]